MILEHFPGIAGFDWDAGNINKNVEKHSVACHEAEEPFFNDPMILLFDAKHSNEEHRYSIFGRTNNGRELTIVFTIRKMLIRVISARDMNKKEREYVRAYES